MMGSRELRKAVLTKAFMIYYQSTFKLVTSHCSFEDYLARLIVCVASLWHCSHAVRVRNGDHKWHGGPFTKINNNADTLLTVSLLR